MRGNQTNPETFNVRNHRPQALLKPSIQLCFGDLIWWEYVDVLHPFSRDFNVPNAGPDFFPALYLLLNYPQCFSDLAFEHSIPLYIILLIDFAK